MSRNLLIPLVSFASLLAVWQFAAWLAESPVLPAPGKVALLLVRELESGRLPQQLGATLRRVGISFALSMSLGCFLGILLGRNAKLDRFFDVWLTVFLNIPALVVIILCYVWLGLIESAAITAVVVNKLPNVVVTLREGARHLDRDLLEMAQAYRFSRFKTLRHVIWPQLFPFFLTASRTGVALIWKIVLVVEILGRSDGMGYQLHLFFQMFDVAGILAYSVAFVLVVQMVEWGVFRPMDRALQRWRR